MKIQSYQIHNVLNVYRRTLTQTNTERPRQFLDQSHPPGTPKVTNNKNNQSIMDKVAANVIKKVTNINPGTDFGREMIKQIQPSEKEQKNIHKGNEFIFNTLEDNNSIETRSIAIDNSQMLMRRLDELAKSNVNDKAQ